MNKILTAVALLAFTFSCHPRAKAVTKEKPTSPAPDMTIKVHENGNEGEFLRMCLAGRGTVFNHSSGKYTVAKGRLEYPDERFQYCLLQVENYRSALR